MNNKILIVIAVTAIVAAVIFNRFSKGKLNNLFSGIKNPTGIPISEDGVHASPSPKPKVNFSQTGSLSQKDNQWYLVNEEATVKLQFNKDSVCDFDKGGQCDQATFREGNQVWVDGVKTGDAVLIIGMTWAN